MYIYIHTYGDPFPLLKGALVLVAAALPHAQQVRSRRLAALRAVSGGAPADNHPSIQQKYIQRHMQHYVCVHTYNMQYIRTCCFQSTHKLPEGMRGSYVSGLVASLQTSSAGLRRRAKNRCRRVLVYEYMYMCIYIYINI